MRKETCPNCGTEKAPWSAYCLRYGTRLSDLPWDRAGTGEGGKGSLAGPAPGLVPPAPPPTREQPPGSPVPPMPPPPGEMQPSGPIQTTTPSRSPRILIAVAVLVALVGGALVFVSTRGGGTRAWAFQFHQGTTYSYRMTMKMDGRVTSAQLAVDQPIAVEMAISMSWRVVSVDDDGVATISVKAGTATVTVDGETQEVDLGLDTTMRIGPDGRVLSGGLDVSTTGAAGPAVPGTDQFTPLLPDREVQPGDTWTDDFEVPFPFGEGVLHYTSRSQLLRYETIEGVRAGVIRSDVHLPLDFTLDVRKMADAMGMAGDLPPNSHPTIEYGGQMDFTETSWFDREAGEMLDANMTAQVDMTMHFEGFPEGEDANGDVEFIGTFEMQLERLP